MNTRDLVMIIFGFGNGLLAGVLLAVAMMRRGTRKTEKR